VDKESRIMSTGGKTSSSDHKDKTLKPSARSLLLAPCERTKLTAQSDLGCTLLPPFFFSPSVSLRLFHICRRVAAAASHLMV
jgi:hypothetical protein